MGCSLVKSVVFLYCTIKRIVDRVPKRFLMYNNASARVVTECEKGNQLMLTVSTS